MPIKIIKASGKQETFDPGKLERSLIRSGAAPDVARSIAEKVTGQIAPLAQTRDIYRLARKLLKQRHLASGMRYSLKKAIMSLGPSGYPFEYYIGRILRVYGYSTEVGKTIKGFCVDHEVDVVATKDDEHILVECKYHSDAGKPTDVKVALYIHARFNDIRKAFAQDPEKKNGVQACWLVTNTRCTTDAIQYAECTDLKIVSWRYPGDNSLEKLIEDRRLYPATILPSARKATIDTLFRNGFILAQDIADLDLPAFIEQSGIDTTTAQALKREADAVCPCTI